jgi:hypothetical protein
MIGSPTPFLNHYCFNYILLFLRVILKYWIRWAGNAFARSFLFAVEMLNKGLVEKDEAAWIFFIFSIRFFLCMLLKDP